MWMCVYLYDKSYYRALVNFTDSIVYRPDMEDIYSLSFQEISDAVVDTLESEYNKIPGIQTVNVVLIKQNGVDVLVELDVGSDYNNNENQIRNVLYGVVKEGTIASYITSVQGFQFRRLGEVIPNPLPCMKDEHTCQDGGCIPLEYLCDNRPDCNDMSDELDCGEWKWHWCGIQPGPVTPTPPTTTPIKMSTRPLGPLGPCKVDQATCQNGECVPRDYLCDGERDCSDGSDEFRCGTPSPCEPNEFKCKNGRCALKLWRCDGDNDCEDNSDETDCPTRGPGDTCAPEQFVCLSDRTCIPSSYQCDEEPDCPDRSDEFGCTPPTVTNPPEESIEAERGETVTFNCVAVGVPTPIITWRLNWGHIPISGRISMTSENGRGSLTIRDVKEADQGAYTCEAINAKGLVFGIPDGVLSLTQKPGNCPDGHFSVEGRCISCFCFGITKNCGNTGRYRNQINLRFTDEDDFKGVNVTYPSRPGTPPLSSTQLLINPEEEEFQLVDLSRRFLILDSFWTLPRQFLGNKIDSYGGSLKYKVRYTLARGETEPEEKPDVVLTGNGQRLVYRRGNPTPSREVNQKEIKFTEDNWQHSSGRQVSREDLMMTLASLESISIRTVYDNHMVSVALSDIVMDTTTVEYNIHDNAKDVEECRCPPGYSGLSCEQCSTGFERVSGGNFLGSCAGCNCNGHASACDPISGQCLSCQHNTEGPQCDKCRPGYFGDPRRGRPDDCKPCPCPYTETSRRFSDTCFLDHDSQATCDACAPGYTGRRCEKCASGYQGNPLQPNGKCFTNCESNSKCDIRGTVNSNSRPCACKSNVAGSQCDECKSGSFHLTEDNPEGCLQCFCMGVTKQCVSSTWSRDQVSGPALLALTHTTSIGGSSGVAYRSFSDIPKDIYYWVLPDSFRGDKVTAYGGELRYTVHYEPRQRSLVIDRQPDVVLQGNGIFLEHFSQIKPLPPATVTVTFRESAWRRADGQPCTREHLLMALADTTVFMIRECACPQGYNGPSCQECDVGYTRTGSGLYLGTCERCDCNGHASGCDLETGACLQCLHNTAGPRCERCLPGFYGNPVTDGPQACQSCPCPGTSPSNQYSLSCYKDVHLSHYIIASQMNVEGPDCSNCKQGTFHLSTDNKDGCLSCFCMGVTQQCSSSSHDRDQVSSVFAPGNFQGFALVNRQRTVRISTGFTVEVSTDGTQLSYSNFDYLGQGPLYWRLLGAFQGDKVNSYGGKLKYTISYVAGQRGTAIEDADVQIIENWRRPDGMPATREHLMMVLADLDDILVRASYYTEMRSSSISEVSMEVAVPNYSGLAQALEVEQCRCPPAYQGLSCQDCAPGYTRTGGGLYLGHCELCECNGHSDSCHPENGICTSCLHNTQGELCEQCAPGFYGDPTAGTPEDCQPCACPHTDPDNQFSPTCESLGNGGYQCTACQPGYTGQYCERCATGYVGNPQDRIKSSLVVKVYPERVLVAQGSPVTLRCQVTGPPPHYYYWSREDGRPVTNSAIRQRQGEELHIPSVQPSDTGMYVCTCRDQRNTNRSRAEIVVTTVSYKPIQVTIEEPKARSVTVGATVSFICTAKSQSPAYTLVWTRRGNGKLPNRAMDFNGILTIQNVQPEDAGIYVCTGSNMFAMDEGTAVLYGQTAGTEKKHPVATVTPSVLTIQQGGHAEFHCTVTGNPTPAIEWIGKEGLAIASGKCIALTKPAQTRENGGEYICKALNTHGEHTSRAVLHVSGASLPHVQVSPQRVDIYEGETLRLYCRAGGRPSPGLTWKKQKGQLPPQASMERTDIGTLLIPNIKSSDSGTYLCVGTNSIGSSEARIEVTASGEPRPSVTWHRLDSLNGSLSTRADVQGGDLQINLATPEDAGTYKCVATNKVGTSEAHATVTVRYSPGLHHLPDYLPYICPLPKVMINVRTAVQTVMVGNSVEFECQAIGEPQPTVRWSRVGGPLPAHIMVKGGMLKIEQVSDADAGQYRCTATNNVGSVQSQVVLHAFWSHEISTCCCCLFPLGELVTTPLFDGKDSYIAYPPLTNIHNDLRIEMEFKPMALDGLMFFSVGKKMKTEDFVSLEMVDGYVQFRYELGTGESQAVLRSPEPIILGQWHRVEAGRLDKDGSLTVDGGREVRRSSPGKAQGLNIHTPMYLGGVPNFEIVPKTLNNSDMFYGCVGAVRSTHTHTHTHTHTQSNNTINTVITWLYTWGTSEGIRRCTTRPEVCGHLLVVRLIPKLWALIWSWSPLCCYNSLHSSGKASH
uniref:Heparan sulfate proteoglycan 2 n=1 Tax=Oncorhynchus mykiss TaxID=8022 RepID=A0A8C7RGW8_ONCMY